MRWCASVLLAAALAATAAPVRAEECTEQAVAVERERNVPAGLLHAVALVESGHNGKPHAYALRIARRAYYPPDRDAALKQLRNGKSGFVRQANVGCMQISLADYGWAFRPSDAILDPAANVRFAAEYLVDWKDQYGSWTAALSRYQGGSAIERRIYVCTVRAVLAQLVPASAAAIDGRHCTGKTHPQIDPANVSEATALRAAAANK
ncbi:MAG TPA: transglycosylase SLT domain-containing protein [Candidatus Cybelea sp.]|nr:transglycosylase SLT domain-containing protein [Candidatus Cybelea sp.]